MLQSPHRVTRILLTFVLFSTIFGDYWEYSRAYHADPNIWLDLVHGSAGAPMQYRIGVVLAADMLRRHMHMGLRHAFTLVDLAAASLTIYLLFSLFQRRMRSSGFGLIEQWFGVACFVVLVQYYFAWTTWYQRPETLPSAAVLAATLWLLTVRIPLPGPMPAVVTSASMLVLVVFQGFIRADVAVAAHLAIFFICLTRFGNHLSLPRAVQASTSGAAVLLAGAIQYFLARVAYPNATYGTTHVFALIDNFTDWLRLVPFALFMLPWAWLVAVQARKPSATDAPGIAMLAGSAVFVAAWWTLGKVDEVRVFLPYAVVLVPLTCTCAIQQLLGTRGNPANHPRNV